MWAYPIFRQTMTNPFGMFFERSYHRWDMESKLTGDNVETPRPLRFASGSPVVSVSELDDFTVHPHGPTVTHGRKPLLANRALQNSTQRLDSLGTTEVVAHSQSFRWFGNWRDWHVRLVCGYSIDVITLQSMTDSERDASVDSWRLLTY